MATKLVNIVVPMDWQIPEIISTFAPEENAMILTMGASVVKDARNVVANLSQKEIYQKIENEFKTEIKNVEFDLLVQKKLNSEIDSSVRSVYEKQIEQLRKQIDDFKTQIKMYETDNREVVNEEVNKVRDKCNASLEVKDTIIDRLSVNYEKMLVTLHNQTNKSSSHKGSEGEKKFEDYAYTFIDFKGYNLIDKHSQGGQGDFHLQFEEFDVLVDAKNYQNKVPLDQRDKIKNDLLKNEHISFAWLVSLNTSIDKFDKGPIMYEWINTSQCIIYINNLSSFEDPQKILRIAWFTCKEMYRLIENVNVDELELTTLKDKQFKLMDKIKIMKKNIRELNTSINSTKNIVQMMDDQLKEIMDLETANIVNSNISLFDDWWENNIEIVSETNKVSSTDIWNKFKQDNKSLIKEMEITVEKFKQFIKTKVPFSSLELKNKHISSAFEIKGVMLKVEEPNDAIVSIKEKIDVVLVNIKKQTSNEINTAKEVKIIKPGSRWCEKEDELLKKRYKKTI
jgi:conjugal transfer/entry exclusion protein